MTEHPITMAFIMINGNRNVLNTYLPYLFLKNLQQIQNHIAHIPIKTDKIIKVSAIFFFIFF